MERTLKYNSSLLTLSREIKSVTDFAGRTGHESSLRGDWTTEISLRTPGGIQRCCSAEMWLLIYDLPVLVVQSHPTINVITTHRCRPVRRRNGAEFFSNSQSELVNNIDRFGIVPYSLRPCSFLKILRWLTRFLYLTRTSQNSREHSQSLLIFHVTFRVPRPRIFSIFSYIFENLLYSSIFCLENENFYIFPKFWHFFIRLPFRIGKHVLLRGLVHSFGPITKRKKFV